MNYSEIAKQIISLVGGNENITSVLSCMTRLRIEIRDKSKVDKTALGQLAVVKGLTAAGTVIQLVLLKELDPIYDEVMKLVDIQDIPGKKQATVKDVVFNFIQGVFVPLVPILVVYGFMSAIMVILESLHVLDTTSSTWTIFNAMKQVPMYFFPVLIGITGAKYLKTNIYVSVIVAGLLIYPDIIAFSTSGLDFVTFLGIPVKVVNYSSSVIPMVLGVFVVKGVDLLVSRIIPASVKFLRAFFIFLISVPLCLWIAAPAGAYITMGFSVVINFLTADVPVLGGLVIGALSSILVIFGMHTAVIAILIVDMVESGSSAMVSLLYYGSVILAGMALGACVRAKNKTERSFYVTALVLSVFTGVVEPALYGIALRFKRCFIIMIVVGSVNGVATMLLGIRATAMGNGIFGFPGFVGTFVPFILVYLITMAVSAVLTYFWGGVDQVGTSGVTLSLDTE